MRAGGGGLRAYKRVPGVQSWLRAIAHKCDTETLYISYLLRLHETGLAGGAGAEFDQCGIEGILILTCD